MRNWRVIIVPSDIPPYTDFTSTTDSQPSRKVVKVVYINNKINNFGQGFEIVNNSNISLSKNIIAFNKSKLSRKVEQRIRVLKNYLDRNPNVLLTSKKAISIYKKYHLKIPKKYDTIHSDLYKVATCYEGFEIITLGQKGRNHSIIIRKKK